jgi:hypothetical protein
MVNMKRPHAFVSSPIDSIVSTISGEICLSLAHEFGSQASCFFLIPTIAFEVKKIMTKAYQSGISLLDGKFEIANNISWGVATVLSAYDIDSRTIERIRPEIQRAAVNSLRDKATELVPALAG